MGKKKGGWKEGPAGDYLGLSTKAKLGKKFGIKGPTGGGRALEMQGLSGSDYRSNEDFEADIASAMNKDYHIQRSLEAAGLAGDRKAAEMSANGFKNYKQALKGWDHLTSLKKEHVGGGGMFGDKNASTLTSALVSNDRDRLLNELKSSDNIGTGAGPDLEPAAPTASDYLTDSYGFQDVSKPDTPTQAAQDFRKGYTADVVAGLGLEEQTGLNLSNAMKYIS